MKQSSPNSKQRRRLKAEMELWATRELFQTMFELGISVTTVKEAEQTIDLAAKLMTYAFHRTVTPSEVKAKMLAIMEEEEAHLTRH